MALRPIDLQNIVNASVEVAKITQVRNDTPNMHQGQFAIQFQKETDRRKEQIQRGRGSEKEETKIKDEEKEKKQGKEKSFSSSKNKERTQKEKNNESFNIMKHGKHIDIRI